MAACQWAGGKWKTVQEAKAQFGHSIQSRRKTVQQHTNPHINKDLTHLNFSYRGLSYQECCKAYDTRMSEIDQGRPGSGANARTIMQSVILYPPVGLIGDPVRLRQWFESAGKLAENRFGRNLIDIAFHFDEVHEYTEPKTKEKRVSREHGHMFLTPEVDGKLNGKAFSCRQTIVDFNEELQEMSIREFGCPMMDGSKAKGGRKVEDMKAASRAAEIIAQAEERAQEIRDKAEEDRLDALDALERALETRRAVEQEAKEKTGKAQLILDMTKSALESLQELEGGLRALEAEMNEQQQQRLTMLAASRRAMTERIQGLSTVVEMVNPQDIDGPSF